MKTKMILAAVLIGAAAMSAQAGVHFGFSFGLPAPVVVAPVAPVVVTPPPLAYAPSVAVPACPGPGYIWTPGYWSAGIWVPGCWQLHGGYGPGYWHGGWRGDHGWRR